MKTQTIALLFSVVVLLVIFAAALIDFAPKVLSPNTECSIIRLQVVTGPNAVILESSPNLSEDVGFVTHDKDDLASRDEMYLEFLGRSPFEDMGFAAYETAYCVRGDVVGVRYLDGDAFPVMLVDTWKPLEPTVLVYARTMWRLVFIFVLGAGLGIVLIRKRSVE